MNKKGFTLVELMAVIVVIAILSVSAIVGVNAIIEGQKVRIATQSEKTISESAISKYTDKNKLYLPACKSGGKYINIDSVLLKSINNDLRRDMAHENKKTDAEKMAYVKAYIKAINEDNQKKRNFSEQYFLNVDDINCFKLTSVADLISDGYLKDLDNGCDKSSLLLVYKRGDSSNKSGVLESVQETGICNGSESEEKGPIITVEPEKDLSLSTTKEVKVTVTANTSDLVTGGKLVYGWSKSLRSRPSSWKNINLTGNKKELTATLNISGLDEEYYLWVQAGCIKDNKGYSNPIFATGPYAFLATPIVTYSSKNYDSTFPIRGGYRCNTETTCNGKKKTVVYSKTYGKDINGYNDYLCTPACTGYKFVGWKFGDKIITNDTKVETREPHTLNGLFTPKEFVLTFDSNGGSACIPNKMNVIYDEKYESLCTTNKEGHSFAGWWTSKTDGTQIRNGDYVAITSPITVYAHWNANKYYVAYNGNNNTGGSVATHQCTYGVNCFLANNGFTRINYTFNGWKRDNTGAAKKEGANIINATSEPDATVTYYAQWCNNCITPTHGSCTLDAASTPGTCKYTTSCNTGYNISGDGTYNPTCTPKVYSITYDYDGGTKNGNGYPVTYTYSIGATINGVPTRAGYSFNGWIMDGSTKFTQTIGTTTTGNKTVKAKWCQNCASVANGKCTLTASTAGTCTYTTSCNANFDISGNGTRSPTCTGKLYTITYDYDGGTKSGSGYPDNYRYGTGATINGKPTKTGYTFNGWIMDGSTKFTQTIGTTATGNKNPKAKWCQNCASVSNGSCTLTATAAGTCTYTTSCNTGYHYSSGANTRSPVCAINTYTVKISLQSDHISSFKYGTTSYTSTLTKVVNHGTKITISATSKDYHQFTGWSDGDKTKTNRSITVTKDLNITAQGRCNMATVNYHKNGATLQKDNKLGISTSKGDPVKTTSHCADKVGETWSPYDYTRDGSNLHMKKKNKKGKSCTSKESYKVKRHSDNSVLNKSFGEFESVSNKPRYDFLNLMKSGLKTELKTKDVEVDLYARFNCPS